MSMKLTADHIGKLLRRKEDERVEFKRAASELPDNLWETYSAFCNTDGGTIILGIREGKNKTYLIEGVSDAHKLIDDFWTSANNPEKVSYSIFFGHYVYPVKCGRRTVVVIEVPRAPREARPVTTDDDTVNDTVTRPENGSEPDQNPTRTRPEVDNKVDNNAEGDNKVDNKVDNNAEGDNKHDGGKEQPERKSLNELPASCRQVLKALSEDGSFTQQALIRKLNFSRAAITKAIATLIKERYIIRRGARKNGYWEVLDR